jgi:hypothetical protein
MRIAGLFYRKDRLVDLERTVDSLNGQLREMQWKLYRAKEQPLALRLWRNLANRKTRQEFMSAVCNRPARPNTKMVSHADARV